MKKCAAAIMHIHIKTGIQLKKISHNAPAPTKVGIIMTIPMPIFRGISIFPSQSSPQSSFTVKKFLVNRLTSERLSG
jgi:hypothetical protein